MCRPVEVLRIWSHENQVSCDNNEIIYCAESITNDLNDNYNDKDIEIGFENVFKKTMKGKHQKTHA